MGPYSTRASAQNVGESRIDSSSDPAPDPYDEEWDWDSAYTTSEDDSQDPDFDPDDPDGDVCGRPRTKKATDGAPPVDYDEAEQTFLDRLTRQERKQFEEQEKKLWEDADVAHDAMMPLRFRILSSSMPSAYQLLALQKVRQLREMDSTAGEYHKLLHWLEGMVRLPLGKFRPLPIDASAPVDQTHTFLGNMLTRLDQVVYGHTETKVQIVQTFARWIANPHARGLALGIQGPPGVGKTSLVKDGICTALGLPFASIPLGGANDLAYLDGHGFTYEGSTWGRIADALMACQCTNPVLFFDELDKVSDSSRGQEIVHLLIHLTDPAQNVAFHDKYFHGIEIDLSKAIMIFSYNDESLISPILRDRLVTICLKGYTQEQKTQIARHYLLPSVLKDYGFAADAIRLSAEVLREVMQRTAEEQGVRHLRRNLDSIVGNVNVLRWVPFHDQARFVSSPTFQPFPVSFPFEVQSHHLTYFLRPPPEVPTSHAMMYL